MAPRPNVLAVAGLLALLPLPAVADADLGAYQAVRAALLSIWNDLPLTIRNVSLTEGVPAGYADYVAHDGNSYHAGETIHVYAEVLGYGWRDNGDGTYSRLLDADLALLDANGTTVASKPQFLTGDVRAREKLLESDLAFNVSLSAFPPGPYKLRFTVRDRASTKQATFEVPITLVGGDASSEPSAATSSSAESPAPG